MFVDGATYRCNVQLIFMENEVAVTRRTVDSLLDQLQDGDTLSILLNGGDRTDLAATFSCLPGVVYRQVPRNLGVAGGRNVLLGSAECAACDVILFVDNDVVVPSDYVERMVRFLHRVPRAGVVGATMLRYSAVERQLNQLGHPYTGYLGERIWSVSSPRVRQFLCENPYRGYFDHVGINANWEDAYFTDRNTLDAILHLSGAIPERTFFNTNSADPTFLDTFRENGYAPLRVSNVPGCCQTFRRELLDEIGMLNDLFNMYGFEDTDFNLRAMKAGYHNYVDLTTFSFHGTDGRHATRNDFRGVKRKIVNQSRAHTVLEYLWKPEQFPRICFRRVVNRLVLRQAQRSPSWTDDALHYLEGIRWASHQLRAAKGEEFDAVVTSCRDARGGRFDPSLLQSLDAAAAHLRLADQSGASTLAEATVARGNGDSHGAERLQRYVRYQRERQRSAYALGRDPAMKLRTSTVGRTGDPRDFAQISRFKDRHAGERCFIIGNGPSLQKTDLSMLKGETTFGVNGLFYMTDLNGFRPTYYVVEDNHVVDDNRKRISEYAATYKFFPDKYRGRLPHASNVVFLPTDWSFYNGDHAMFETPQFSFDLTKTIYVGQTVTYLNLQLAYYMGFETVYLVGMDFSYAVPSTGKVQGFTITSACDDPNHFHPDYFGKGKKWHFPKLHNCIKSYVHAKEVFEQSGRRIYNATIGGKLKVFSRVEYGSIFRDCAALEAPTAPAVHYLNLALRDIREAVDGEAAVLALAICDRHEHFADARRLFCREVGHGAVAYQWQLDGTGEGLDGDGLVRVVGADGGTQLVRARPDLLCIDAGMLGSSEETWRTCAAVARSNGMCVVVAEAGDVARGYGTNRGRLADLLARCSEAGLGLWVHGEVWLAHNEHVTAAFVEDTRRSLLDDVAALNPVDAVFASEGLDELLEPGCAYMVDCAQDDPRLEAPGGIWDIIEALGRARIPFLVVNGRVLFRR